MSGHRIAPWALAMRTEALVRLSLALVTVSVACGIAGVSLARAAKPWWHLSSETLPTNLAPGSEGEVLVIVSDLGDAPVEGGKTRVFIRTVLPKGLSATGISGGSGCLVGTLTCEYTGTLYPYQQFAVKLKVKVDEPAGSVMSLPVQVSVEGGGAGERSRVVQVPINGEPAGYGVEEYELSPFNENGTPATVAGSHPFELTTTLVLNQNKQRRFPVELPKDFAFHLPPGLVGNPNAVAQCTMADFFSLVYETNHCSPASVVGVATVAVDEPKFTPNLTLTVPVFNLVPAQGEPARFGLEVAGKVPIVLDTAVRSGGDYGVDVSVHNATQTAGLLNSQVTFWGVPGDPRHDSSRGWECVAGGFFDREIERSCPTSSGLEEEPFLTLPSSCASEPASEPVAFSMDTDSWAHPGAFAHSSYTWSEEAGKPLGFTGCNSLLFGPSLVVEPEEHAVATPTGLHVNVSVPQEGLLDPLGVAEADVRDTTVTLPEGVELSPSAANGLEACTEEQVGFTRLNQATDTDEFNTLPVSCPDGSKVGTVRIKTPLLSHELEGWVYLASPAPNGEEAKNPFGSLVALYLVAEDPVSGVLVKLAGEGQLDEGRLRIATTFRNAPEVPFEELSLDLFGGPRASVTTPLSCGSYATSGVFTPWSGTGPVNVLAPAEDFLITSGVGGSGCPSGVPFAPGFTAYSQNTQAGAFTNFSVELSRPDGDQALSGVSVHLPPGIAALLSTVQLCSDAQAAASECPPSSEVGEATAVAGLGSEPYVQEGGKVFITGPYGDAPFGLEIVTPAKAGPFDLGYVTVRSKLYIDPNNASVTIVSDPLPTQIRGIPLQLKRVLVTVDRPGFEFNPTSCDPMEIAGTITGAEHASAAVATPFQVGNCSALPFSPQLKASAVGHGSKAEGTTFKVTVTSGGTNNGRVAQAGIAKVDLQLPKQLSSRLPTLQQACPDSVFNQNPASCDEGSVIGYATIHTPVLKNPLTGPAYLVSHGGAAFPDVEFLLQGEGIELILDGQTDIKGEVTYSKFESTPDAPFTIFETVLPAGPHGVLTPNVPESKRFSLCGETLVMPTTMIAHNGLRIDQETTVAVTGCGEVKGVQVSKLTLKQKLKRSLNTCRHKYRHAKHKRARCERQVHKRYTRQALTTCRHKHQHAKHKRRACERKARKRFAAKSARPVGKAKRARG
jgi:hypothetical protein